jgi:hypothetical protein
MMPQLPLLSQSQSQRQLPLQLVMMIMMIMMNMMVTIMKMMPQLLRRLLLTEVSTCNPAVHLSSGFCFSHMWEVSPEHR